MLIPYRSKIRTVTCHGESKIHLHLQRKNGETLEYVFERSVTDMPLTCYPDESVHVFLEELPNNVQCLLLMCAESSSLFTDTMRKTQHAILHLETITEDDDLLSPHGKGKSRRCIGSNKDCAFFAGPCTGGSPWNRKLALERGDGSCHQDESYPVLDAMG